MKRKVLIFLMALIIISFCGCDSQYNDTFKGSKLAIDMMEKSIDALENAISGEESVDNTIETLNAIVDMYDEASGDSKALHASLIVRSQIEIIKSRKYEMENNINSGESMEESLMFMCNLAKETLYSKEK